jgi:hypothetical protein
MEIDLHFVRDHVALGEVRVLHVPMTSQYTDIFTKDLPTSVFVEFRSSLNVRSAPNFYCGGVLDCKRDTAMGLPYSAPHRACTQHWFVSNTSRIPQFLLGFHYAMNCAGAATTPHTSRY